jgi:hypothetical protein
MTKPCGKSSRTLCRNPAYCCSFLFLAILVCSAKTFAEAASQASPRPEINNHVPTNGDEIGGNPWAEAKPYLDDPLPKLKASIAELKGLDPASSQERLSSLLDRAGEECAELLRSTPNVTSREEVITVVPKSSRAGFSLESYNGIQRQTFDYLLISHETPRGIELREYRSVHGRPASPDITLGVTSQGFISERLRLYPGNRSESRFRYLGQQVIDNRQTFVLAFAQIPEAVEFPATFTTGGVTASILLQGVLWVDSTDLRIVRIHEDLLAPRPDVGLKKFTTTIRFGEVNIPKAAASLWLPQEVVIDWEFRGQTIQRRHRYSEYRLYKAKARLLPAAP